jgi:cytochrome c oxidase subunit IV
MPNMPTSALPVRPSEPPRPLEASVRKTVRLYLLTGLLLYCGTVATVLVATVPWLDVGEHGFDKWDALLGLGIATFKASMVAAIFMHLNHERRMVYSIIGIGVIHAVGLFIGTYWHFADLTHDRYFFEAPANAEAPRPAYVDPPGP